MTNEIMPVRCRCKVDEERHEPEPTPFYLYGCDDGLTAAVCTNCGLTIPFDDEEDEAA